MALKFNPTTGKLDLDSKQSLTTLDARYVNVTGDTMTGDLNIDSGDLEIIDSDYGIKIADDYVIKTYGTENLLIGQDAGINLYTNSCTGERNVYVGRTSGRASNTASFNMGMGEASLFYNETGRHNLAIGYRTLFQGTDHDYNVALGSQALGFTGGDRIGNVAIGYYAGRNSSADYCTYIGRQAGYENTRDYSLHIAYGSSTEYDALIYGEFNTPLLRFNSDVEVKGKLHINGTADDNQLIIKGHSTQTANLTEWQNSSSTVVRAIKSEGATQVPIETITTNDTLDESNEVVLCDCSSQNITINLPASSGNTGLVYTIKKIDSSTNIVTIDGNSAETIDGDTTKIINTQYDSITLVCSGTEWSII